MSFNDWGRALGCTDRTAVNIINRMIEKGLIWKKAGKFEGGKQERNAYFTYDINTKKESGQRPKGKPNGNKNNKHYIENPDSPLVKEGKNWFIYKSNLTVNDCVVFIKVSNKKEEDRTPGEKALFETAKNRIEGLRRNPNSRDMIDDMIREAKRKIEMENNKKLREENDKYIEKISTSEYNYHKKRKGGDRKLEEDWNEFFESGIERFLGK